MYILFVVELLFVITALALFAIAQPDLYRTLLWQDGADNGFNSSPVEVLYGYANHKKFHVPLVWSYKYVATCIRKEANHRTEQDC